MQERGDRIFRALGVPCDTVMGYPLLYVQGSLQLRLENHRGLRELTDTRICLATARGGVTVTGRDLCVLSMDKDTVTIRGKLQTIDLTGLA